MDNYKHFEAEQVLRLIGIDISCKHGIKVMTDCPVCQGKGKLSVNKETGLIKCWRASCGFKGNVLTLYAHINNMTNKEAYKSLCDELGYNNLDENEYKRLAEERRKKMHKMKKPGAKLQPEGEIDNTYRCFLDNLELSSMHHEDLLSRGLSEGAIQANMYKTISNDNLIAISRRLIEDGCKLEGIPGFFQLYNGKYTFRELSPGFFVPYRNEKNEIVGIQMRVDESARYVDENGKKSPKYFWVSSDGFSNGCGSGSPAHWACDYYWDGEKFQPVITSKKCIGITEGALKGDIFYNLTGIPCICIAGVNIYNSAEDAFKKAWKLGFRVLFLLFDMDSESNEDVQKAFEIIKVKAQRIGFHVIRATWKRYIKGVDDYYNMKRLGKADFESLSHKGECCVCKKDTNVVECKSRTGNKMLEYCEECLEKGYEPYEVIVEYAKKKKAQKGKIYPEEIPDIQLSAIKRSLDYFGITEETLLSDIG